MEFTPQLPASLHSASSYSSPSNHQNYLFATEIWSLLKSFQWIPAWWSKSQSSKPIVPASSPTNYPNPLYYFSFPDVYVCVDSAAKTASVSSSATWRIPIQPLRARSVTPSGQPVLVEWMRTCPLPLAEWGSPCSALWKHSVHISVPFVNICVVAALWIRPSQERWCVLHVPLPLPLPWQTLFPTLFTTEPRHRLRILLNTALDNHSSADRSLHTVWGLCDIPQRRLCVLPARGPPT